MGERFGKFEIITKIATGGMAEIFLARQEGIEGFKKIIVLKKILPHLSTDKEFVDMFLDEARMAAQLNHPNIVQIYDLGVINGSYFIAMEYVDGVDLSSILKRGRERKSFLRLGWILKIISQCCEGLYYAHSLKDSNGQSLGLIHRDITPENLLISFSGNVKIADFGIARARGRSTSTTSGTLKGKFPYMSYEMVKGMKIDSRSDIFSLGIVMWEMLTYRRLFKRDTEVASISAILNEEIPSPKKYFKNLPLEVESIVMKALDRDREKRFQTMREFGDAIEDFIVQNRIVVRISDLSDYLRGLFPDREISTSQERLSSSKLQKIVEIKGNEGSGNSLPIVTIQKRNISTDETVVLPPKISGDNANVEPDLKKTESKQEDIPLSNAKSSSEVMEENKYLELIKNEDRTNIEDNSLVSLKNKEAYKGQKGEEIPEKDQEMLNEGFRKGRRWLIIGAGLITFILIIGGVLFFIGKEKSPVEHKEKNNVVGIEQKTEVKKAEEDVAFKKERSREEKITEKNDIDKTGDTLAKSNVKPILKEKKVKEQKYRDTNKSVNISKEVEKGKSEKREVDKKEEEALKVANLVRKNGFFSINSEPWAEVYIEGKKVGDTPIIKYELPSGSYNVVLKNPELGFEKIVNIRVNPEENSVKNIKFGKGYLNVQTNIPSEVRLGANLIGKTPLSNIDMYEGIYRITLFDPNQKKSKTIKVEIKAGKRVTIQEDL